MLAHEAAAARVGTASAARWVSRVAVVVTVVPALASCFAVAQIVRGAVSWFEVGLLCVMYALTIIGVETGFHRLIAHRSFSAGAAARALLCVLGSMAAEGPIVWWVATHRRHHERSDQQGDPHSPHVIGHGDGLPRLRGFLHAHVGWMWSCETLDWARYAPDVLRDRVLLFVQRTYVHWLLLGMAIPAALGWAWLGGLEGALRGLLWGGLVRVFLVHQAMWCVASVCHLYGTRPYRVHPSDRSRNNAWVAIPTMGEGWHNNHHAFPSSARHGLEWWEVDINYMVIRGLQALGAARDLKVPTRAALAARRRQVGEEHG